MHTSGGLAHVAQRFHFHPVLARQAQQAGGQREARIGGLAARDIAHGGLAAVQLQRDFWLSDTGRFEAAQQRRPINKSVHPARISADRSQVNRSSDIGLAYAHGMKTRSEYGSRLKQARQHAKLSQKQLAALAGMSQGNLSELETIGHSSGMTLQLAVACGVDAHWLATGQGQMLPSSGQSQVGLPPVAHPVILDEITVIPKITWEDLVSRASLPLAFEVTAPDASMAPKVPQGTVVKFERGLEARPGDGVLVRDREGHHYLRIYREKRPGHWEAYAINDAYSPLDSQADGLTVVAVLTAVAGRWA